MTTPTYCTTCGHELGIGRFCTNCGQPVPGRHPEAAPTSAAPVVPPPTGQLPPAARYPLFAEGAPATQVTPSGPPPPPPPSPYGPPQPERKRGVAWLPWVIAVVLVALVAGIGVLLLVNSGGSSDDTAKQRQTPVTDGGSPGPTSGEPAQPDSSGTGAPVQAPDPADVIDLTGETTAEVPATAPPSRDRGNHPVTFGAANLLDGRPRTSWRMPGDGTGLTLTFDLGRTVVLTQVGLINGYAKVDGADNWYRGNRRIQAVQWEFDDGTRITQELVDRPTMQPQSIDPVETRTVKLHLITVSAPGKGPNGRDFTAISDVLLRGAPA
ncbi:hypothetical protein GCM10022237_31890 [Nocardioides ginsengisoli]|uniref:NAD glycohydrolase translocation F5/8 type C domain-containing protein n=1 Tax=Nocardioides ginsengisoli TaxID=363868 RepID=A0ABW3W6U0_9ACTN